MEVRNNVYRTHTQNRTYSQSFGNRDFLFWKKLSKDVCELSSGTIKRLQDLGLNNGENLNNIVTAIGTAGVAPIFIRYNPISHEDPKTKAYTAARQPISAIIALGIQLPAMTAYNNMVDRHASTLKIPGMDLSGKPRKAALIHKIRDAYQEEKMLAAEQDRQAMKKSKFYKNKLDELQKEAFYKELGERRERFKTRNFTNLELVKPDEMKAAKNAVFKEILINEYGVDPKSLNVKDKFEDFGKFKKEGKRILKDKKIDYKEFEQRVKLRASRHAQAKALWELNFDAIVKKQTTELKHNMQSTLNTVSEDIRKMSLAELNTKYPGAKGSREAAVNIESKKIFNDCLTDLYKQFDMNRTKVPSKDIPGEMDTVFTPLGKRLDSIIKKLKRAGSISAIREHGDTMKDTIQSVKIKKNFRVEINRAEDALRYFKKVSGIFVGLLILPFTCGLLNWAYPRIMERYFPELSAAKKAKAEAMMNKNQAVSPARKEAE